MPRQLIPAVHDPRDWEQQRFFDERVKLYLDGLIVNEQTNTHQNIMPPGICGQFESPLTTFQEWFHQGNATVDTESGELYLEDPGEVAGLGGATDDNVVARLEPVPDGWSKMTAFLTPNFSPGTTASVGIMLYDETSGYFMTYDIRQRKNEASGFDEFVVIRTWDSYTNPSGGTFPANNTANNRGMTPRRWVGLRIFRDSGTWKFQTSHDNCHWLTQYSVAVGSLANSAPTDYEPTDISHAGIFVNGFSNYGATARGAVGATFHHAKVE